MIEKQTNKASIAFYISCVLFLTLIGSNGWAKSSTLDSTYQNAQRKFWKKNYKEALPLLERYILESRGQEYKRERLFWVIDQIGRIHIRVNRDPEENTLKRAKRSLNFQPTMLEMLILH